MNTLVFFFMYKDCISLLYFTQWSLMSYALIQFKTVVLIILENAPKNPVALIFRSWVLLERVTSFLVSDSMSKQYIIMPFNKGDGLYSQESSRHSVQANNGSWSKYSSIPERIPVTVLEKEQTFYIQTWLAAYITQTEWLLLKNSTSNRYHLQHKTTTVCFDI